MRRERRRPEDREGARRGNTSPRRPRRSLHGLARWISKFGLMSRTEAERAVRVGQVTLNGKRTLDPERPCNPQRDRIEIGGRPLREARRVYLALHKPPGAITTARDPQGRPTVYDLLPPGAGKVQAVGRLDADTSGLLLFTNDPAFASRVTDSAGGIEKVYEALVAGTVRPADLRRFEAGLMIDGVETRPARCAIRESEGRSTRVEIVLTEGRNRQIRRMWEALGYRLLELHRTRIGPIALGDLAPGRTRPITEFERVTLLFQRNEL